LASLFYSMRIHIISNLFAPDELAGAALFTDLASFLKEGGHDVRVTCAFSYYPAWKLRAGEEGLASRDEVYQGIPLRRVRMYVPNSPTAKARVLSDLSFLFSLVRRARFPGWEPEVVLTALPMLSQCLAQRFLYLGKGIPRLIVVQDFVVDAALELGILRLPGCARLLHGIQRWALRSAQTLLTISPGMLEKLRGIVGADRRTCYVPNWIHGSLQREINRQRLNGHVRNQGELFYAGNLGVKQGLSDFLEQFNAGGCAKLGWRLQVHGGGAERGRIATEIGRTPGCQLGPILGESDYVSALCCTSACLVTQRAGVGANFLPSKILPALATSTPVLAVCERSSPLGQEVIQGGFGEVIEPGDSVSLASTLRLWQKLPSPLHQMGSRAAQRAELYHQDRVLTMYERELSHLPEAGIHGTFQETKQ
jgi:colanic acid biosynthesis glycosyl transferase WcaI